MSDLFTTLVVPAGEDLRKQVSTLQCERGKGKGRGEKKRGCECEIGIEHLKRELKGGERGGRTDTANLEVKLDV